jgi:hypothetical protein
MWEFFSTHFWAFFSSLGIIGAVILAIGFFVFGWQLVAITNLLRAVVEFFKTPLGQVLGIAILCGVAAFAADVRRTRIDAAICKSKVQSALTAAAERAEKARVSRDEKMKLSVKADADKRIAALEAEKNESKQKADDYEAALSKRPGCLATDDDLAADRLQNDQRH